MNLERVQKYYELIDRELGLESDDDLFGFESEEDDLFGIEGVKSIVKKSYAFVMSIIDRIIGIIRNIMTNKRINKFISSLHIIAEMKDTDKVRFMKKYLRLKNPVAYIGYNKDHKTSNSYIKPDDNISNFKMWLGCIVKLSKSDVSKTYNEYIKKIQKASASELYSILSELVSEKSPNSFNKIFTGTVAELTNVKIITYDSCDTLKESLKTILKCIAKLTLRVKYFMRSKDPSFTPNKYVISNLQGLSKTIFDIFVSMSSVIQLVDDMDTAEDKK